MDGRTIRLLPSRPTDDLIRLLPGVDRSRSNSAFTNYGQLRVSFNGSGNDRGAVLVDGIPATDGFGGQVDWAAYPASDLWRAELLRGPGSALYGSGAIGGVLALSTYEGVPQAAAPVALGDAGGFSAVDATLRATHMGVPLDTTAFWNRQQLSYDDLPPAYSAPNNRAALAQSDVFGAGARMRGRNATTLVSFRAASDLQDQGRSNDAMRRHVDEERAQWQRSYRWAAIEAVAFARDGVVTNIADRSDAPGTLLYTQLVPTHESGSALAISHATQGGETLLRAAGRWITGESDQYAASGELSALGSGKQRIGDVALQQTLRWTHGEFVAGFDATAISTPRLATQSSAASTMSSLATARALLPRGAVRFDVTSHLALRVSGGAGIRAPFLNELVRGYQIGKVQYQGNPSLLPERSESLGAGLDWQRGATHVSLDLAHLSVKDAIAFATIDATHQLRSNLERTQTDGITLDVERRLTACSSLEAWTTQQHARVTSATAAQTGKWLAYVPQNLGGLSYAAQSGAWRGALTLSYSGLTYADDLNMQALGAATIAGLHVERQAENARAAMYIDVQNATSAHYLSSIDRYGPPPVVRVGVRIGQQSTGPACR